MPSLATGLRAIVRSVLERAKNIAQAGGLVLVVSPTGGTWKAKSMSTCIVLVNACLRVASLLGGGTTICCPGQGVSRAVAWSYREKWLHLCGASLV